MLKVWILYPSILLQVSDSTKYLLTAYKQIYNLNRMYVYMYTGICVCMPMCTRFCVSVTNTFVCAYVSVFAY